ncbi:glycosyltransferase [Flavobacterium sediminilitoris]|uniref:Glycosyltransferase n=1 Tax=Flavobacterium sediminilitoris TaxID=2024526 RepID=A0ABY4HMD7_9FLAO|nr:MULTISPECIES: glycosyltransferase [Flavobacterium]UOX34016.1 glycosyltransferase [Flavobacterium sediminilitoris]
MAFKFLIVTHVQHISKDNDFFGYSPYVNEMNIWNKYCDEVILVAPLIKEDLNPIYTKYAAKKITFIKIPSFNLTNLKSVVLSFFVIPIIIWKLIKSMKMADHIHLRCPGNIGLLGSIVQIFFPNKKKTAKYAGNWDPKSKQPLSYRLQKWILSNTFLTRNMQVLVYGEWENQTKNIKSFFTATYREEEVQNEKCEIRSLEDKVIQFLYVGTLSKGKQPLYAIQIVEELSNLGKNVKLNLYGEGVLRNEIETYILKKGLNSIIILKGNQAKETVLDAYQNSHFLVLPSKSEGWPKVVAESMFWGCVPISTPVSCVSYMLDKGNRGIILNQDLDNDVNQIKNLIGNPLSYFQISKNGMQWSRQFTMDKFEIEIKKLL